MKLPKIFKKVLTAGIAFAMAIGAAGCGGDSAQNETTLNIATGGTAGIYYPIGNAIAEVINKDVSGVNASAQMSGASVANIDMLADGKVEMAIVQNDVTYYAVNGKNMFDKKYENLRGIASLYAETCQFVTTADSGIMSIEDLRGKRVAVGAQGSGVEENVRQILQVYGLTYDDIDAQFLSFSEGANALKDGTVDVACVTAGYPTVSIQNLATQENIRLIPIDETKIIELIIEYPFYTKTVIPAGVYQNFNEEITTVSVMAILVATDKMDDKTGYDVTKAIFNNTAKIAESHDAAKNISKKAALMGMGFIQMNEGAERFFQEQ